MVLISLVVMIVTVFNFELRCLYSKPVYRNYDENFRNIAVTSDFVYIGGNSKIIKLDSSLIQLDQTYVSMEGRNSIYDENWLLTTDNNASLIVCNYDSKYNTLCLKLKLDLSVVTYSLNLKSKKPSTKYLATTFKQSNVLIIASSKCLSYHSNDHCLAISSYLLDSFQQYRSQGFREYVVQYLQEAKHVTFRAVLEIEKFIYFLFNTEDGYSKIGKMCKGSFDMKSNSFEDTPMLCSLEGKKYTLAQDAVYWKEYLFVAFSDDFLNVICKYKIRNMAKIFMESRQDRLECPYDKTANIYFGEQRIGDWCFNKTRGLCQSNFYERNYSCPELTDTNDGFCNSIIFGSVEGPLPITEDTSIYSKDISKVGAIVKLGVLGFSTHSVIYAGTTTGKIGKIFMDDRDSRQIGSFKIVQHSFPVLDIKVNNNEDVYVMTENCVVNIADKDPCSSKLTCLDCMKSKNPACGWDIPAASCKTNGDTITEWLPSVGGQCLQIKATDLLIHDDSSNSNREEKSAKFRLHPDIKFDQVFCQYEYDGARLLQAMKKNEYYYCSLSVGDVPFILNIVLSGDVVISTKINVYKLSAVNSCKDCVMTSGFWCVNSGSCVMNNKDCTGGFNFVGIDMENDCPMIKSAKLYMSHGQIENLRLEVANLHQLENRTQYLQCSLNGDKYDAYIETGNRRVICQNVKAPNGHSKMYLQYNNSNIGNSTDIEVYRCDNFASCEECKYQKHQNYRCDWCGSCVTTLNGGCSKPESCPISIYRIDPSFGPENGGTLVNVTGNNIGYPNDNITVIINGAKCININVIESSSVLSCYSGNANATTSSNGVIISVNGLISSQVENLYEYKSRFELLTLEPDRSIISGGQTITITGVNIGFEGSRYSISFCNDEFISCIWARLFKIVSKTSIVCIMGKSDSIQTLNHLLVDIDNNTKLRLNHSLLMVADPTVLPLLEEDNTVFKSGGVEITIQGNGFSAVGEVKDDNQDDKRCFIKSDTKVICKSPKYIESDFQRRKRSPGQPFFVSFDNYVVSIIMFYVDDPVFEKLPDQTLGKDLSIVIKGQRILEGAKQEDYTIHIGLDGKCIITDITNFNITCLPPYLKPKTSTDGSIFMLVEVGSIKLNVGRIHYPTSDTANHESVLYGVIGCIVVTSILCAILVIFVMRLSMNKKLDTTLTEWKQMKEEISRIVAREGLPDRSENMRLGDDGIEQIELTEAENSEVIVDEASASDTRNNNYEDLGQRSSHNPYCQLQQASVDYQMQDMTGLDNRTRDLSPTEYINLQV
ncbi:plexin A [Mytilus galloprovincialis]|uniref:Plexin A n=1 Tax=Mytilus galloprovincialis TaxID=29158 RepID=A0A8B6ETZ5_MYTGA|nr:plexin A [Mytilus galloprovincialis]